MARILSKPERNKQKKLQAEKMKKVHKIRTSPAVKKKHRYRPGQKIIMNNNNSIFVNIIIRRNCSSSRNQKISKIN